MEELLAPITLGTVSHVLSAAAATVEVPEEVAQQLPLNTPSHTHPALYILHPAPLLRSTTPYTLHPAPCNPHPTPYTLHPFQVDAVTTERGMAVLQAAGGATLQRMREGDSVARLGGISDSFQRALSPILKVRTI